MQSRIAEEIRRDQQQWTNDMSAAERLDAALALGERAVADYMQNFRVSRDAAVRILRKAGQAGRRYSACLDEERNVASDRSSR